MISVRPPLSSVMLRSASAFRRSLAPDRCTRELAALDDAGFDDDDPDDEDVVGGGGAGGGGAVRAGAVRPGKGDGDGFAAVFVGADDAPDDPVDDEVPGPGSGGLYAALYEPSRPEASMPIA